MRFIFIYWQRLGFQVASSQLGKNMKRGIVGFCFAFGALSAVAQVSEPAATCFDQLNSDPALIRLLPHVGSLSKNDAANFEMIVSKRKPSEPEKKSILAWGSARQKCVDIYRENLPRTLPAAAFEIEDTNQGEMQQLLATLYRGQMTYGEFVETRKKLGEAKITKLRQLLAQEQDRQQRQENEKMQQEVANAQRAQQQEQYQAAVRAQQEAASQAQFNNGLNLLLMSRPRPPAPLSISPSINCTSRASFGTVVTNCN